MFVTSNLKALEVNTVSKIYGTALSKIYVTPQWRSLSLENPASGPLRRIEDIQTSKDLFEWVKVVGIPSLAQNGFNQVLYIRFSLKRHRFKRNAHKIFGEEFPFVLKTGTNTVSAGRDNGDGEAKQAFSGKASLKTYEYSENGGFNRAGAFVFLHKLGADGADGGDGATESLVSQLASLEQDGWFDP